jgi:type IV secretion system protein TrbI
MNAKKKTKEPELEKKPIIGSEQVQASQINKPLVVSIIGIIIIILVFIIIDSMQAPQETHQSSGPAPKQQGVGLKASAIKQEVKDLPGSYQDGAQINKILHRDFKPRKTGVLIALKHELDILKQSQAALKAQLATLQAKDKKLKDPYSKADEEAMDNTEVFFGGGMPPYIPPDQKKEAAKDAKPGSAAYSSYASQNMQEQKDKFYSEQPKMDVYNKDRVQYPISKYILQAGTVFPAILQTRLNSDNPGVVMARISTDVYDSISGKYLLLPKGSKLLGQYNSKVSPGQSRLQVKFLRLIRPDGSSISLPSQPGMNTFGVSGFQDTVNSHWGSIIGAAALMAVFDIPNIIAQNEMNSAALAAGSSGGTSVNYSAGGLQAFSQSTQNIGQQLVQQQMKVQPTLTVHAGYLFSAFVTKDIVMPPYGAAY